MFKNMKLSMKIAAGFSLLLLISIIMGVFAWQGLSKVLALTELNEQGVVTLEYMNQCATTRRDFAIRGFTVPEGQTKHAADRFHDAHGSFSSALAELSERPGLRSEERRLVSEVQRDTVEYGRVFDRNVAAQRGILDAFAIWRETGNTITRTINEAVVNVLEPELRKAREAGSLQDYSHFAQIRDSLNEVVIANFLLLRVEATALTRTEADREYNVYREQLQRTREGLERWTSVIGDNNSLREAAQVIDTSLGRYDDAGQAFYNGAVQKRQADTDMGQIAGAILQKMHDVNDNLKTQMEAVGVQTNAFLVGLIIGSIIAGVLLAVFITRAITKSINQIIAGLTEGASQVASASGQVSAASQSLAEGATEQAAGLEETSSSLEEMSSMTKQNADNAQQANTLAAESQKVAASGAESMQRMSQAIDEIQKSSEKTSKIIKTIDEIAFQTNLLALNAAVEAARAGEAGKGFAVVAEEVRNLAMRSAEAAKNTANMIEESVKNAQNGVNISGEASKALDTIVSGVSKTAGLAGEIAAASAEQAQGIDQVSTAVAQMDKVTQQNAANAEESAGASEELSAQAEQMQGVVNELTALVGGAAETQHTLHTSAPRKSGTAKAKLGLSDHTFHHIAEGGKKTAPAKVKAVAKSIPLDDDLSDFNA